MSRSSDLQKIYVVCGENGDPENRAACPLRQIISRHFHEHPNQFADAFARAWFKLTRRDIGPVVATRRTKPTDRALGARTSP
jgi:hypothetical protein